MPCFPVIINDLSVVESGQSQDTYPQQCIHQYVNQVNCKSAEKRNLRPFSGIPAYPVGFIISSGMVVRTYLCGIDDADDAEWYAAEDKGVLLYTSIIR